MSRIAEAELGVMYIDMSHGIPSKSKKMECDMVITHGRLRACGNPRTIVNCEKDFYGASGA